MALVLEHCSKRTSRNRDSQSLVETYVGLESEVDAKISTLQFGQYTAGIGALESWEKEQRGGVLYAVTITYTISYDSDGNADSGDELSEVQQSTLDCAILSLPLEANPNYRANWNYYLIGLGTYCTVLPSWWSTAKDTFLNPAEADFKVYRWIKQLSELPTEPDANGNYWQVVKPSGGNYCKPQKMGVETWDYQTYTISEVKQFSNREKAGAAASKKLNKVMASPEHGDFSVTPTGCNWKVDATSVQYNGDKWIVSTTYTMSGPGGWDAQLYTYIN